MSKSNPFLFITGMVQTSKNVLAAFYHNKRAYNNFMSNKSKKIHSIAADSLNRIGYWHDLPIDAPDWSYGESFIYSVSALGWKEMVDGLKEETKAYMRKNLPGFEQAEKIPDDDNPVLVYFRLKDF